MNKAYEKLQRDPDWTLDGIAYRQKASKTMSEHVLAQAEGTPDGRSQFYWFRLSNGDLILGVYPRGDTYFDTERDRSI